MAMDREPSLNFDPEITVKGDRTIYRSAIRFRLAPESAPLVQQIRALRGKQCLWDTAKSKFSSLRTLHESGYTWPLGDSDEWGVVECSFSGPVTEAGDVQRMHDMHVASQLRVLNASHGPATILAQADWLSLDPYSGSD